MLLLQRRIGESIYIGDDIKITVLDATGRQVRLGIQAPRDIAVHREEIYHRIQRENGVPQENSSDQPDNADQHLDVQGNSSDSQPTDQRKGNQQPAQIRYRSANPYRKNSPSYRNNDQQS